MKAKLKNGEVIKIADYDFVELEHCDSYGDPIQVKWDEIEQILDDDGCPLGMPKFPKGRIIEHHPDIDWEARRYEIAKEVTAALAANPYEQIVRASEEELSKWGVEIADALIEELKKA